MCLFVFDLDHHSSAGKIELVVVGKWNEEKGERLEHIGAGAFTFGRWRFIRIEYRQRDGRHESAAAGYSSLRWACVRE